MILHRQCWWMDFKSELAGMTARWLMGPDQSDDWYRRPLVAEGIRKPLTQRQSEIDVGRACAISSDIFKRSVVNNLVLPALSSLYFFRKKDNILLEVIRSSGVLSKRLEFWDLAFSLWLLLCRWNGWEGGWSSWRGSYSEVAFIYFLTDLAQCRQKQCMFPDIGPVMYGLTLKWENMFSMGVSITVQMLLSHIAR